jgi:hypothetical protein
VSDRSGGADGENRHGVLRACSDGRFVPVLWTDYVGGAFIAAETRTAGWRDLLLVVGEPDRADLTGRYVFNGARYELR